MEPYLFRIFNRGIKMTDKTMHECLYKMKNVRDFVHRLGSVAVTPMPKTRTVYPLVVPLNIVSDGDETKAQCLLKIALQSATWHLQSLH